MKKIKIIFTFAILLILMAFFMLGCIFLSKTHNSFSKYDMMYYFLKDSWWIPLVFTTFYLFTVIVGVINKNRTIISLSLILICILTVTSLFMFIRLNSFSTDDEHLIKLEEKSNVIFPKGCLIILENKTSTQNFRNQDNIIDNEGIIMLPSNNEFYNFINQDENWIECLDSSIQNQLSYAFFSQIEDADNFFYSLNENNLLVLAYLKDKDIILFINLQIID